MATNPIGTPGNPPTYPPGHIGPTPPAPSPADEPKAGNPYGGPADPPVIPGQEE